MPPARRSRRHRSPQGADIGERLIDFLRMLVDGATGRRPAKRGSQGRASIGSHERRPSAARRRWFEKRDVSLWRLAAFVCVLLASIWVAWRIIALTAAQSLGTSDPEGALDWFAQEPAALDQLAQQELTGPNGDLEAARRRAQNALLANPLDARALSLLGLIAERKRDQSGAEVLMRISGARTWRDPMTQSWLFNNNVRRGDFAGALPHMDAILRSSYEFRTQMFPVLAAFAADSRAFKALADFLATAPPWREWFLFQLSGRLANQSRLVDLYGALGESKNPPTKDELRPYLARLVRDGNFDRAFQTWRATLPPAQRANTTGLYNQDFDVPLDGLPFNWEIEPIAGADIQVVPAPEEGGKRTLRVQFSGARVAFANVRHLLILPPGSYAFEGRVKAEELRTARGLWWRVFCADGRRNTLAQTELASGTFGWTDFSVDFRVPTENCTAQWVQLELPARIAPEQAIEGQIWYQGLRISQPGATGSDRRGD